MAVSMISQPITCDQLKKVNQPISQALKLGDTVYVSAQYPCEVKDQDLSTQCMACIEHLALILGQINLELRHVVKTTLYLTDYKDLETIDLVYATYFPHPYPVRSLVLVSELPDGVLVGLDCIAIDTLIYEEKFNVKPYNSEDCEEHDCDRCPDGFCQERK